MTRPHYWGGLAPAAGRTTEIDEYLADAKSFRVSQTGGRKSDHRLRTLMIDPTLAR